jgi:hypothetical protein
MRHRRGTLANGATLGAGATVPGCSTIEEVEAQGRFLGGLARAEDPHRPAPSGVRLGRTGLEGDHGALDRIVRPRVGRHRKRHISVEQCRSDGENCREGVETQGDAADPRPAE